MESIFDIVECHFNLMLQRVLLQKVKSIESIFDIVDCHFNLMLQIVLLQKVKSMESILVIVHYHFNLMLQRVLFAKCKVHGVHLGYSPLSFQHNASNSTFTKK